MNVSGTEYYYLKNAQGDITHIVDGEGNEVAAYEYDAWGNHLSISGDAEIAELNPYRYRGYRYDSETGLYYLQSRYYNPEWGRFINADVLVSTGQGLHSHNMFAYCNNNPVNYSDSNGLFPIATVTGALIGGIAGGIRAHLNGQDVLTGVLSGATSGALVGLAIDLTIATGGVAGVVLATTFAGAVGGGASSVIDQVGNSWKWGNSDVSLGKSFQQINGRDVAESAAVGLVSGAVSGLTAGILKGVAETAIPLYTDALLRGASSQVVGATGRAIIDGYTRTAVAGIVADIIYTAGTNIYLSLK